MFGWKNFQERQEREKLLERAAVELTLARGLRMNDFSTNELKRIMAGLEHVTEKDALDILSKGISKKLHDLGFPHTKVVDESGRSATFKWFKNPPETEGAGINADTRFTITARARDLHIHSLSVQVDAPAHAIHDQGPLQNLLHQLGLTDGRNYRDINGSLYPHVDEILDACGVDRRTYLSFMNIARAISCSAGAMKDIYALEPRSKSPLLIANGRPVHPKKYRFPAPVAKTELTSG